MRLGTTVNSTAEDAPNRPLSGKSGQTAMTGPTNNQTQFTANQTSMSSYSQPKIAMMVMDKNTKLADFIKFDSTLGREQNIGMGKESSLSNTDIIKIKGGVTLTQFAPYNDEQSSSELADSIIGKGNAKDKKTDPISTKTFD